jgi:hypothetical protein
VPLAIEIADALDAAHGKTSFIEISSLAGMHRKVNRPSYNREALAL